uniref:Uncharacterized protein n=1 Tax=Arundo donax TaxID=35708 RepID=A0A0A9EEM1_ARUDO
MSVLSLYIGLQKENDGAISCID